MRTFFELERITAWPIETNRSKNVRADTIDLGIRRASATLCTRLLSVRALIMCKRSQRQDGHARAPHFIKAKT